MLATRTGRADKIPLQIAVVNLNIIADADH
jgi:hypothetical protein